MIKTKNIDIFASNVDTIIYQTNCFNIMGAGIASVISQKWPIVSQTDAKTKPGDKKKLGTAVIIPVYDEVTSLRFVVNAYGQFHPGPDTRPEELKKAFISAKEQLERLKISSLGIPYKIGCGIGGENWEEISKIIEDVFKNASFDVILCKRD